MASTPAAFHESFARFAPCPVAIEAGTHSLWAHEALARLDHEVVVANPRKLQLLTKTVKKTDAEDAELLARMVVSDLKLIAPVCHRSVPAQLDRMLLKLRSAAVRARSSLIVPEAHSPDHHPRVEAFSRGPPRRRRG